MLPNSERVVKVAAWNCCIVVFLWLVCHPDSCIFAEARRNRASHRLRNNDGLNNKWRDSNGRPVHRHSSSQYLLRHKQSNLNKDSHGRKRTGHFQARPRPTVDARTERIRQAILTLPELSKLLDPIRHASNLNDMLSPNNKPLSGTVRRRRLYCRVGIGYHLEIRASGKVVGRHSPTKDGILEIFSVSTGVVGFRGIKNQRYLCMNIRGKLYSALQFGHECEFRERIEANNFNTYASNLYSNHEKRTGYYMSLTKRGRSKRSKGVSGRQTKAHWLPRSVND